MTHVIPRSEWGATPPRSRKFLATIALRGMALHYTAAEADQVDDPTKSAARVRGIQRYHMEANGWADIAYNFLTDQHGQIFEGRGWDIRSAANGTNQANDYWLAVAFLGADKAGRDDVTEPGRRAIRWLCDEAERRYPGATQHRAHSSFKPTSCPGDEIRHWLARGMPVEPLPAKELKPMYDPAIGPIAAVWLDEKDRVLAAVSPDGEVYAWAVPYSGGVRGKPYWGNRKAALIGAPSRPGGVYDVTATDGASYTLPDGLP